MSTSLTCRRITRAGLKPETLQHQIMQGGWRRWWSRLAVGMDWGGGRRMHCWLTMRGHNGGCLARWGSGGRRRCSREITTRYGGRWQRPALLGRGRRSPNGASTVQGWLGFDMRARSIRVPAQNGATGTKQRRADDGSALNASCGIVSRRCRCPWSARCRGCCGRRLRRWSSSGRASSGSRSR